MGDWRIQFFGKFEVWTPDGQPLQTPTRKEKAIIGLLAVSRRDGMTRDELAAALWPQTPAKKRGDSLRNSLALVRKALGADMLESSPFHCRLSDRFTVKTDLDSAPGGPFMPEFKGEWFEAIRLEFSTREQGTSADPTVCQSLLKVLQWYAQTDPARMHDTMRSSVDLVLGLSPGQVRDLITESDRRGTAPKAPPGWRIFWDGLIAQSSDIAVSSRLLESALQSGVANRDYVLAGHAIGWLGATKCLSGEFDAAAKLAQYGVELSRVVEEKPQRAKLNFSMANVYLHTGRHLDAMLVGERVVDGLEAGTTEWAYHQALIGLYEACAGRTREAEYRLQGPLSMARQVGSHSLTVFCSLAQGYLLINSQEWEAASQIFSSTLSAIQEFGGGQCEIYAREGLAVSLFRSSAPSEAAVHFARSKQLRSSIRMRYSAWDRTRLKGLAKIG